MTAKELRQKYLDFFKSHGHAVISSASLLPENDPTTLFISAGMQPFVPYLLGEKHPAGDRIADVQKCVRTGDIEEVGDTTHHTFFEMLGNWSLGAYFKEEAIKMSWEFLTDEKWLGLDKNRLAVTVFGGDGENGRDEEARRIWLDLGVPAERIAELGKEDNWWPAGGKLPGPQGPDSEMFYFTGEGKVPTEYDSEDKRWVEVWNDVFMEFKKTDSGYEKLSQKNVDTGMGLERTLAVLNGLADNYRTELFWPLIEKIQELSGKKYEGNERGMRIVADHIKAAVMILGDERGVEPANTGAGYVLRRLIRRAVRYGKILGIESAFTAKVAEEVVKIYGEVYPEVKENKEFIKEQLSKEEEKFGKTIENGLRELEKIFSRIRVLDLVESNPISGKEFFDLFQTYGLPVEISLEEIEVRAKRVGYKLKIDKEKIRKEFKEEQERHAELSKTASAGMFKGGLADTSEQTVKLHTAAHLMLEAMRRVLGSGVEQKGSNITAERLRFDVSFPEKITEEQIEEIEQIVNEQIEKDLPVRFEEMDLEEAREIGATGVFDSKYGERVKVYFIGEGEDNFSKEICGGPHVERTGILGRFKITKQESVGSGVRRIKAVLE